MDGISKRYQDRRGRDVIALENVSFSAASEEFLAILGPSGCGKSTLLGLVAGLLPASAGGIFFEGERGAGRPLTATVFQEFALFPWRTAQANIELGLEELGLPAAERAARARRHIEQMGLRGFEDKYPHQLSGGMRQRVGIARALAVDPAVLLMDEPFSALDAQTREIMQTELLRIWDEGRKTVLFVTHQIDEAVYLADRVIVLARRPGRVQEIVPISLARPRPLAVKRTPEFVAIVDRIWRLIEEDVRESVLHEHA